MNLNGGIFLSLFNKVLASIGVGAATVDTKLHKSSYTMNETVKRYAMRKAREEARSLIAKLIRQADDDVVVNVAIHLIHEVADKNPAMVFDCDFIDVLESLNK